MNTKAKETQAQTNKNLLFWRNKTMKTAKVLLTLALAIFLSLGATLPVFAEEPTTQGPVVIQETGKEESLKAAIAKILKMPIGTDTPDTTFEFTVTKVSYDNVEMPEAELLMPTIDTILRKFEITDTGIPPASDVKYVILETKDIFEGVKFENAGIYVYEIRENNDTFTEVYHNLDEEKMVFSTAVYTITAYVRQSEEKNAQGDFEYYIYALTTVIDEKDTDDQVIGDKVDPTPKDEINNKHSGLVFTNTYTKRNNGDTDPIDPHTIDPDDPDTYPDDPDPNSLLEKSLIISKEVTGAFANPNVYFNYEMKFNKNSLMANEFNFVAYIIDTSTPAIITPDANNNITGGNIIGNAIIINSGVDIFEFSLKHNQTIAFYQIYMGTRYEITEKAAQYYTPAVEVTYYGSNGAQIERTGKAAENSPLTIPLLTTTENNKVQAPIYIGASNNKAEFTNDRDSVTPTGLNLNDLPFIGMIIIAIGGVAGYVGYRLFKNNKRKDLSLDYNQ